MECQKIENQKSYVNTLKYQQRVYLDALDVINYLKTELIEHLKNGGNKNDPKIIFIEHFIQQIEGMTD